MTRTWMSCAVPHYGGRSLWLCERDAWMREPKGPDEPAVSAMEGFGTPAAGEGPPERGPGAGAAGRSGAGGVRPRVARIAAGPADPQSGLVTFRYAAIAPTPAGAANSFTCRSHRWIAERAGRQMEKRGIQCAARKYEDLVKAGDQGRPHGASEPGSIASLLLR